MSESAQPQLPPRLLEHPEFMNRMMNRVAILEAENESLKAERDKALEAIREYRFSSIGHRLCSTDFGYCPTCIKADALLPRETKEEA